MKDVVVVTASRKSEADFPKTRIFPGCQRLGLLSRTHFFGGNSRGLPSVYNTFLTEEFRDKIVLFAHDDLSIEDMFLVEKVTDAVVNRNIDIVGVAGATSFALNSPVMWHLCAPEHRTGMVAHRIGPKHECYILNFYGIVPRRVVVLDGLFLAVNVAKALDTGLRFDEQFDFHFYDLDFCLTATSKKMVLSTWPIWVVHDSPGGDSPAWREAEPRFIRKWQARQAIKAS